jgi:hypothetical protein
MENPVPMALLLILWICTASALTPKAIDPPIQGRAVNRSDAMLVIGNESYSELPQVVFAERDAEAAMAFSMETLRISKWRSGLLLNPTGKKLNYEIGRMARRVGRGGTLWVYYSGHGYTTSSGERALVPADADSGTIEESAIPIDSILEQARNRSKLRRVVLIIDAGFGNIGRDGLPVYGSEEMRSPNPLPYSDPDTVIWIPTEDSAGAPGFSLAQHGLFTYLAIGALRGWADGELDGSPDQVLTLGEAQAYVANTMVQLGFPIKPSQFKNEQVYELVIREGELEIGPDERLMAQLSKEMRGRRFDEAADYTRAQATSMWQDVLYDVQKGGSDGEEALKRFLNLYEHASVTVDWTLYVPQVAQARRLMQDYERLGNIADFDLEDCKDTIGLEANALVGKLSEGQIACLESRIRLQRLQTERSHLSGVLIIDAQTKGLMDRWEVLVQRHLERYDRSDPDLTFGYSVHLYRKGEEHHPTALRWADYALENSQQWEGGTDFVEKTTQLYKLRAILSTSLWIQNEKRYRNEKNPENQAISEEAKGIARDYALEWLVYARASGAVTKQAFDMCVSAAGDSSFCIQ